MNWESDNLNGTIKQCTAKTTSRASLYFRLLIKWTVLYTCNPFIMDFYFREYFFYVYIQSNGVYSRSGKYMIQNTCTALNFPVQNFALQTAFL